MTRRIVSPDQLQLELDAMLPADRARFEAAITVEAERRAFYWRFRLVAIETVMMASLVLVAGLLIDQPTAIVVRAAITVAIACFASGLLLIWLSSVASGLMARLRSGPRR
ncbi:hypothetical protein [Sphingopyxis sp. 22461]|uniref:hypothetical protein n=1 Tax=Sphingopyxis sp. 22461 TaxID=3453923 RepID=UPI003F841456